MEKLRFGLAGYGKVAELHARAIVASGNSVLVSVCGRDPQKREAFAHRHGISARGSIGEMVAKDRIEAVGATTPIRTAIDLVRKGGTVTLIGNISPTVELPLQSVVTREITLFGSCGIAGEYPVVLDLMARKKIDVRALISAVAPLSEGAAWFDRLYKREPGLLKVVLEP